MHILYITARKIIYSNYNGTFYRALWKGHDDLIIMKILFLSIFLNPIIIPNLTTINSLSASEIKNLQNKKGSFWASQSSTAEQLLDQKHISRSITRWRSIIFSQIDNTS